MSDNESKKRGPRTTKKQIEILINYVAENKILLAGKINPKEIQVVNKKWEELTSILNTCGHGPQKTVSQWKKAFTELRTNTKRRAREVFLNKNATGGGPANVKDLSDVEEKLMQLLTKVVVEGAPVPEAGIPHELAREKPEENLNSNNKPQVFEELPETDVIMVDLALNDSIGSFVHETDVIAPPVNETHIYQKQKRQYPATVTTSTNNSLQAALNRQIDSNDNLCQSLNKLSESIKMLAESFDKVALAMINKSSNF